ncbi:DUF3865 domain-containing protein [Pendulispora albinea]|uniref:DUF3865 domain-containing protein n=1 Tax=Pendulispora albinea TaxID=2741071 RepID=A0ABZ2M102_9BACT
MTAATTFALSPYTNIDRLIASVLESDLPDYKSCVLALERSIKDYFPALSPKTSPILNSIPHWRPAQIGFVIVEYSVFTNAAIHMFLDARIRNHWEKLDAEIVRNVEEEMGVLTKRVPHLELMRFGHRYDLGLETDGVEPSPSTKGFVERMNKLFRSDDNAFLGGCLLAFEATAVDEFRIVDKFLRAYKSATGGEIRKGSLTDIYIAGHVTHDDNDPEADHYAGMRNAIGEYIDAANLPRFIRGFYAVTMNLSMWWEHLAIEAHHRMIEERLVLKDPQRFDPFRVFAEAS